MNTLRLYKIYLLLFAVVTIAGCKKLIAIDPPVSIVGTEKVFETNEMANSALAGIYAQMMANTGKMVFSNGGLMLYAGMSAGELENLNGTNSTDDYQFVTNTLDINNSIPNGIIWKPAYSFIYGANAVIEGIAASDSPQLDDSTRKHFRGEALFIRAFSYFYLTNIFGDVPLVLTSNWKSVATMKRTPQAKVYDQIVKDLEEAQTIMPDGYSKGGGERVRPNKWAATALLARVQLYRQNWSAAEAAATAVIGAGYYNLPADPAAVFLRNSREAIWQLKQNATREPFNITWDAINCIPPFRLAGRSPIELAVYQDSLIFNGFISQLVPPYYFTPQVAQVFDAGDKRRKIWIDSVPTPPTAPYYRVPFFFPNKYNVHKVSSTAEITQYYMVMRLAEQYLVRAEARAQQDNMAGAAEDLNALRRRAGVPDVPAYAKETMLAAIAKERQTELFAEWGHRWLDLKRTNQAATVLGAMPAKQPWKSHQLLYPIPTPEIITNPNIEQNPDY